MDAFTETILTRARERQRMLQGYSEDEKVAPLRECNKTAVSEPNLTEIKRIPPKEVRSETHIPSKLSSGAFQGSPGEQVKTLNIQRDDFNMEIKVNSAENVRVQVEIEERSDDSSQGSEDCGGGLREESKNRLKRLGKLYAGGEEADISSPIHRTEAKFYQSIENDKEKENSGPKRNLKCKNGLSKLADLADSINQWEDDLRHPSCLAEKIPSSPKKTWKPPAPQPPLDKEVSSPQKPTAARSKKPKAPTPPRVTSTSPKKHLFQMAKPESSPQNTVDSPAKQSARQAAVQSPRKETPNSPKRGPFTTSSGQNGGATPKQLNWDKKVLDTLESQGFTRTQSSSRLVYSYNSQDSKEQQTFRDHDTIPEETSEKKPKTPDSPSKQFRSGAIANRAAMFEQKANEVPVKPGKDPALLSLAERKALFEKNKGEALVPKAAFAMSAPVKVDTTMKACETKFIGALKNRDSPVNLHHKANKTPPKAKYPAPPPPLPELKIVPPCLPKVSPKVVVPTVAVVHQAGGIASKMAALLENRNKSTISEEQIANKVKEERQKEMDMLLNRFNKNKENVNKLDEIQEACSDSDHSSESEDEGVDERTVMLKKNPPVIIHSQNARKSAEKRKSGSRLSVDSSDSMHVVSVLEDVKRIKVSPPKAGRLYPNLSDIEATTTDPDTRTPTPNHENSS